MTITKVFTGVLAGIVIGILIAPNKGSKTRKRLSKKVNEVSNYIQERINNARSEVDAFADGSIKNVETSRENINEVLSS